jgi:hypothetical protein
MQFTKGGCRQYGIWIDNNDERSAIQSVLILVTDVQLGNAIEVRK